MKSRQSRFHRLIYFVLLVNTIHAQQDVGDKCYHIKKNTPGTCKLIEKCETAIQELVNHRIPPVNCGFDSSGSVIVCCPDDSIETTPELIATNKITTKVGYISKQKCKAYEDLGFILEKPLILIPGQQYQRKSICPWQPGPNPAIIGGDPAQKGEFPHMALIGFNNGNGGVAWECGGSLISENFVLTAAHCLYSRAYGSPTTVRLGALNYTDKRDRSVQTIPIETFYENPNYNQPEAYNDLALLKLARPAKLDINVKPICLYASDNFNFDAAIVTGWGNTEYGGEKSDHLLKASLSIFTYDQCNKTFRGELRALPRGIDRSSQLCAGSFDSNKDTCQGDSGGPIQIRSSSVHCSYYIVGVTSFGKQCGFKNVPAVYAKVYPHLEWIEKIVWP